MLAASDIVIVIVTNTTRTPCFHDRPGASCVVCQSLSSCRLISDFTSYHCPLLTPFLLLRPPCLSDGPDICLPAGLCSWRAVPPGIHLARPVPSLRSSPAYYNEVFLTTRPSTHHPVAPSVSSCIWVVQCFLLSPRLELQEGCLCPLFCSLLCLALVRRTGPNTEKVLRKILSESVNERLALIQSEVGSCRLLKLQKMSPNSFNQHIFSEPSSVPG